MFNLGGPLDSPSWVQQMHELCIYRATGFKARLLGLHAWPIWGSTPRGLLFTNCNAIHTLGLKQSIDIIYFNKQMQIIDINVNLKPNKFSILSDAKNILELPPGYCLSQDWRKQVLTAKIYSI